MKLLSIAIPTYNRGAFLNEELECILPQLIQYRDDVEIVISDNCSTDNTQQVVKSISDKYAFPIDYKRLDKNIYFEDNFDAVVNRTNGKYIQMMGDDDILDNHFYDRIIPLLKSKNYGLIHCNRLEGDATCSNGVLYDKQFEFVDKELDAKSFIKKCLTGPGFMTSLIFNHECWKAGEPYIQENFYGYHFLGRLYHGVIKLSLPNYYIYLPLILMRNPGRSWGGMYRLFHFVGLSNLFLSLDEKVEGVYQIWEKRLHNKTNRKSNMLMLSSISTEAEFYRKYKKEFEQFLSKEERVAYAILTSPLASRALSIIYTKIVGLFY